MNLDYSGNGVLSATVAPSSQPVEEPTVSYFSPKESDKYTYFTSMQQTINAMLKKENENREAPKNDLQSRLGAPQPGGAWKDGR